MTRGIRWGIAAMLGGCSFDSSGSTSGNASADETTAATTDGDGGEAATTTSASVSASDGSGSASADETSGSGGDDTTGESTNDGGGDDSTGPPDPCAVDNGGCDEDATCEVDDDGEVECECDEGFEEDGDECLVPAALQMLRWELPCGLYVGDTCTAEMTAMDSAVLVGEPGLTYDVELRLRGVLERKAYTGGTEDGVWYEGGEPVDDGGWNSTTLVISDPPQLYRYNNGPGSEWVCELIDATRTVQITAGATVSITVDTENAIIIRNATGIVVPDIEPAPMAFDGQFAQLDAVKIEH